MSSGTCGKVGGERHSPDVEKQHVGEEALGK